jgi:hypothetical protein
MKSLSKVDRLPGLDFISKSKIELTKENLDGFLKSQSLAQNCAREIAEIIQPGWTERQAVRAMDHWLRDHGVDVYFHKPFAWWGSRARFDGIKRYSEYQATSQCLLENEIFILDVAPIVDGFVSDIGFVGLIGDHPAYEDGFECLQMLRRELPHLVENLKSGSDVWKAVDSKIKEAGFENIHVKYPFGVLGHRVYKTADGFDASVLNFGWQSFWEISSRGIFGQLLNADYCGSMEGLWAIEPQIGGNGWGMKFEEILVVENGKARWLNPEPNWIYKRPKTTKGKVT